MILAEHAPEKKHAGWPLSSKLIYIAGINDYVVYTTMSDRFIS